MTTSHKFLEIMFKLGTERKPVSKVYRRMLDESLFIAAYTELSANKGSLTKGTTQETIDSMSMEKIRKLMASLKDKSFRWHPVRRVEIPKSNGKLRKLGIPDWSDRMVQMVLKMVLEAYYEPQFMDCSHGFRPNRSCHTALEEVKKHWRGMKWAIEGDIESCFDSIPHHVILEILGKRIKDNQVLSLIKHMLKAGYMSEGNRHKSYSGTPQGGIVSPLLSNIVLNKLDKWAMQKIRELNKGNERRVNSEYRKVQYQMKQAFKKGNVKEGKALRKQLHSHTYGVPQDESYFRMRYVRYADDFVIGIIGDKAKAEMVKEQLAYFLEQELGLKLSSSKTLITNLKHEKVRFLGYEFGTVHTTVKTIQQMNGKQIKKRSLTGAIQLFVPTDVKTKWKKEYTQNGKPIHRNTFLRYSDFEIIRSYGEEWRGLYNYYCLAMNVHSLREIEWTMLQSCSNTLAGKHKTTTSKIRKKYESSNEGKTCLICTVENPKNPGKPFRAMMGGIPLKIRKIGFDEAAVDEKVYQPKYGRSELTQRLLANECELCGSKSKIEVHHIRSIKELKKRQKGRKPMPDWKVQMIARHRNTLIVCKKCHMEIHHGH